jgi:hypothetical protein
VITTAGMIRSAAQDVLQARLPALLPPLADQEGLPLPPVRTWRRLADFLLISELESPAMVVTTPGLSGAVERRGRDTRAPWAVRVFTVVHGRTYEETAARVAAYVAAARTVLLDEQFLGGLAGQCEWVAENYSELDTDNDRSIGAGSVTVRYVDIPTGLTAGPAAPGAGGVPATDHEVIVHPRGA